MGTPAGCIARSAAAAVIAIAGCAPPDPTRDPGDDLGDGVLELAPQLREISAIVAVDEHTLAAVQDEAGVLFFVDLLGRRPTESAVFGPPGDYEGLTRVGADYWVLRAAGALLHVQKAGTDWRIVASHALPAEHADWESLCHDAGRHRLLLLPKDAAGGGKAARDERPVFAFDLAAGRLVDAPVLVLQTDRLIADAVRLGLDLPTRTGAKGKERTVLRLFPSELAVVPGSSDLLVLTAADRLLLRVDRSGALLAVAQFDADALPQPEGLAFLPDGRLLVASEGLDGPGVVRVVPVPR